MSGDKLFTTWLTSTDRVDHAVTDEEFTAHTPEPEAVCGAVILLAPMEAPPGPRCARCTAFLCARDSLRDLQQRIILSRRRRPGWLGRLLHRDTSTPVVPIPRAPDRHDRFHLASGGGR
jgi:predicted anti-sigma-YlaC factor YlaD